MKAYTDKNKVIDTIGDHVGGENRPALFASSSRRTRQLPTPPRQKLRGSIGSSYFGCARCDLRSKDRSRRMLQTPQYKPNGSTRVGEGLSGGRGRVLSQSLLVARERRRRELGSNLVIVTTTLTSGEGHVVEIGVSQRVRKICAGVPASVSIRDLILALSLSRAKRQYWTVGYRPIRKNDLRSLHRNSVEAQIQDRSRQKTGLNTVPGFSRVYNKPPLRGAKGTRAQHAGDARNSPPPSFPRAHPSFPQALPSFPRTIPSFPRTREPRKTKHPATTVPSPAGRERARVRAQGGVGLPPSLRERGEPPSQSAIYQAPPLCSRDLVRGLGRVRRRRGKSHYEHPAPESMQRCNTATPSRRSLVGRSWGWTS